MALAEGDTMVGMIYKDKAIEYYLKAISVNETSIAYYYLAMLYKDFEEYDKAIEKYKKAIELNPQSYESYNDMGYCYYQLEDDCNALECFKQSYEINPSAMVLRNIGNCYSNLGEYELSEECYANANLLDNE